MTTESKELSGTEHYIYRRDGAIHLYTVGGGEPVIFIHSVGTGGYMFEKTVNQLSRHFACYVVDLPGHDRSDIPPAKYSMDAYADAVQDVIDSIGAEQYYIVGGHTGAIIALILGSRHPKKVRKLVMDGLPYWNKKQGQILFEKWFAPQFTDTTSYHVPVVPLRTWEEAKARDSSITREAWELKDRLSRKSRLWHRWGQEANSGCDVTLIGPKVKVPTLLLFGDKDSLRRTEEKAHEDIKGSTVKVIPDSPGQISVYQPEALAKETLAFLKS